MNTDSCTNAAIKAAVANMVAAAAKCGMTTETFLNTFWDMGSACRANEDDPLMSREAIESEFGDMVEAECREVGLTDSGAVRAALAIFCAGYKHSPPPPVRYRCLNTIVD